jgi:2-(1,2-epoxy-1,2-dihydrophenyl)acetyl-CoA isomerase
MRERGRTADQQRQSGNNPRSRTFHIHSNDAVARKTVARAWFTLPYCGAERRHPLFCSTVNSWSFVRTIRPQGFSLTLQIRTHSSQGPAMNDSAPVLHSLEDGVLTLTLNRPDSLNALNAPLVIELKAQLEAAARDADVGAIVLRGAGRGFSAGGDLREGATPRWHGDAANAHEEWRDSLRGAMEASRLLHQIQKPTIAMVRGPAAGAGLSLATACDLRIASTTAVFTTAFVKVGFSGDFGITYFLTRLVGTAKARELMFLSDKLDAAEALRIGLVNRVVPDEALEAQTMAIARQIANGPRIANRYIKQNLNAAEEGRLEPMFDMEATNLTRTRLTQDHAEAAKAFLEKRPPVFKGK